jgi:hypothetical protein
VPQENIEIGLHNKGLTMNLIRLYDKVPNENHNDSSGKIDMCNLGAPPELDILSLNVKP